MSLDCERVDRVAGIVARHAPDGVVIIPAFNEATSLPRTLDSLARQRVDRTTLVLVHANNCSDATARCVLERMPRLGDVLVAVIESTYEPPNVGLVRAETAAGAIAGGCRWLLFTDADVVVPDRDFLAAAVQHVDAAPEGCWAGWCDEFGDALGAPAGPARESTAWRLLDFARRFRGRELPRHNALFRYTDGANSLVTAAAYRTCGGHEPKPVGGDSTLGDRFLETTGRHVGFFDRPVIPSCRKQRAHGRVGGFVFYPAEQAGLECVRGGPSSAAPLTAENAFAEVCVDLHAFLCFTAWKRREFLEAEGGSLRSLCDAVEETFDGYRATCDPPVAIRSTGDGLELVCELAERRLALDWAQIEAFWQSGRLPA